ncbi:MAG: heat-inducible transcription repressor HrcA [Anaerolineales bacterium]|nr:heat-inducible transcription repressor HrcA [Anaerolineales bacterium]
MVKKMAVLSERQKLVLALLVRDYVETIEPISSGRLVKNYQLDFSSATVRNEMAVLEEKGFLSQPYTSAGRVPTRAGYRYYVRRLMGEDQLPAHIQEMIRHQFYQARHDVDDWLSLSASVLAQHSMGAAIVTQLHTEKARFKHIALLSTRGRQALVVIVLSSGEVHQQTLVLDETLSQEQLSGIASRINQLATGLDVKELKEKEPEQAGSLLKEIFEVVLNTLKGSEVISSGEVYRDGLANMLSEPEFSEPEKAKQTLEIFEDQVMLDDLLSRTVFGSDTPGVHVIIGGEDTWDQLEDTSLILASYGKKDHAMGAVGILGPLRMSYSRGVSTVRFVSDLISELISESMGS